MLRRLTMAIGSRYFSPGRVTPFSQLYMVREDTPSISANSPAGSLITSVLADGKVETDEQKFLQRFFSEFISVLDDKTITSPVMSKEGSVEGVCAACPEITFEDATFCFTGASNRLSRSEFEQLVAKLGGKSASSVSNKLNYLVIGAEGNQCWAYACYGRKVEKAVELRKQGARLLIVHENDFHDAVVDAG